jgi:hypothetical protein
MIFSVTRHEIQTVEADSEAEATQEAIKQGNWDYPEFDVESAIEPELD